MRRVLLSWSSGKDSAWALHALRQTADVEVVGLLTTFNKSADRVAMHAVRRELVEAQAAATGLALWPVFLPAPCSNAEYEQLMSDAMIRARAERIAHQPLRAASPGSVRATPAGEGTPVASRR